MTASWETRQVTIGDLSYPYHVGSACIDRIAWSLAQYETDRIVVVTDETVNALHGGTLVRELQRYAPVHVFAMPPGEAMKSLDQLAGLLERVIAVGVSRRSLVVAFGGGVPGNLAGMLASLLFRGVRLVHLPTTTLAAADSVLSAKQAVNSSRGKNQIGSYHAPEAVFMDTDLLKSLPEGELRSGWYESIKNCVAIRPNALPALSELLASGSLATDEALRWLLLNSLEAKCEVTRGDSREEWTGLVLEYGHTVGHAIELCDERARGRQGWSHGESVAFGMIVAARVSAIVAGLKEDDVAVHEALIDAVGLDRRWPDELALDAIMELVRADNKRGYLEVDVDEAPMVLLRTLGAPLVRNDRPLVPVPLDLIAGVLSELQGGEDSGVDLSRSVSGAVL